MMLKVFKIGGKMENNLFNYAPKELVLDAILCYIINFANSDMVEDRKNGIIFLNLILAGKEDEINISYVETKKQYGESKIDVYVKIITDKNEVIHIVFENKTHTSYHGNQLERHIKNINKNEEISINDKVIYIYLKVGYIYQHEKNLDNYITIDNRKLCSYIKHSGFDNQIINMYLNYLDKLWLENETISNKVIQEIHTRKDLEEIFWSFTGSYIVASTINKDLNLRIRQGSSSGRPFTQIDLLEVWKKEEKLWKALFWRLDWRVNKDEKNKDLRYTPYICLRQYRNMKFIEQDDIYLKKQREIFDEIMKEYTNIIVGKVGNIGEKEREIGIIFINDKNPLNLIINTIPKITEKIIKKIEEEEAFYQEATICFNK
jgi:hypothetical protein